MSVEIGKLIYAVEAETKQFEREMAHIPAATEAAFRKSAAATEKYTKIADKIASDHVKDYVNLSISEQKKLTNAIIREAEKRARAEEKALNVKTPKFSDNGGGLDIASKIGSITTGLRAAQEVASSVFSFVSSTAESLFGLTQGFADAGSQIYDTSQKLALSAETISTVKMAADISGSSLEAFSAGFAKFETSLATGGGKVGDVFKKMGIDIKAGAKDPEQAFDQFLKKFNELPEDSTRAAVATKLFGKSGKELIPTFLELGGSLDAAKKRAQELGLVFSGEAAANADKLGDSIDIIKKQVEGAGYQFISVFAPQVSEGLGHVSDYIKDNKDILQEWSHDTSAFLSIFVGEVDKGTDAMKAQEAQTHKTIKTLSQDLAFGGVVIVNYTDLAISSAEDAANAIGRIALGIGGVITFSFRAIEAGMNQYILKPLNDAIDIVNQIKMQASLGAFGSTFQGLVGTGGGDIPKFNVGSQDYVAENNAAWNDYTKRLNEFFNADKGWMQNIQKSMTNATNRVVRFDNGISTVGGTGGTVFNPAKKRDDGSIDLSGGDKLSKDAKKAAEELKKIKEDFFIGKKSLSIGDGMELRQNLEKLLQDPKTQLFLETIKQAEGGAPNIMAGGRRVNSLATHPGEQIPRSQWFVGPKGASSAAGNYQITRTNWREIAPQLGLKEFSVKNQALVALEIARRQSTKGFVDLAMGNIEGAFRSGTQPWASSSFSTLPGGKKNYLSIAKKIGGSGSFDSGIKDPYDPVAQSKRLTEEWQAKQSENIAKIFSELGLVTEDVVKSTVTAKNNALEKIGLAQTATEDSVRDELLANARNITNGTTDFSAIVTKNLADLPTPMQETVKQFLAVANANKVYGDEMFPLAHTTEDLNNAFKLLTGTTRERIYKEPTGGIDANGDVIGRGNGADNSGVSAPTHTESPYADLLKGAKDTMQSALDGGRRLSEVEQTHRMLQNLGDDYANLTEKEKENLLSIAAQTDAQSKLNQILGEHHNIQDMLINLQSGAVTDAYSGVDSAVNSLAKSLGIADTAAGHFFKTLISGLAKLALQSAFEKLFGATVGGTTGGESSGGGFWSKLLGFGIKAAGAIVGGSVGGGGGGATALHEAGNSFGTGAGIGSLGSYIGHAGGGYISGAGTKTSDSIPIWGSHGEFMQQASAVDFYGVNFMNAINSKQIPREVFSSRKFASGGPLTQTYSPRHSYAGATQNSLNNSENNGRGEDKNKRPTEIHNHFHANENGNFAKPSATQALKSLNAQQRIIIDRS